MNLLQLKSILDATGFPVAYSHFTETNETQLPDLPFICYLETFSSNYHADNKVYKKLGNVQIELYTKKKDLTAESVVETVLQDHEIPYQTTEAYIESEEIYQKIYEVRVI